MSHILISDLSIQLNDKQLRGIYDSELDGLNYDLRNIDFVGGKVTQPWRREGERKRHIIPRDKITFEYLHATDPDAETELNSVDPSQLSNLLETVAFRIIRLFRCEMDLLWTAQGPSDDYFHDLDKDYDVDETVYAAATTLGSIRHCEIDLATCIVDSSVDGSLPAWPSRAIACFVLTNFGLIRRGIINPERYVV
ncbi:hypothetical protein H1R20_g3099, partial [Candolleomyces eurysporus]